jgi:hypothetical protein
MTVDLPRLIIEQLEFDWDFHVWPRLEGLSDDEYLWRPVPDAAGLHDRGNGVWEIDDAESDTPGGPPKVTTIAWRMAHLVDNMGYRANHFFDAGVDYQWDATAAVGLQQLELAYRTWHSTIAALDGEALLRPLGKRGGPYAEEPMIALIVHVNRETIHHGAEIGVLRDLYRAGLR